MRTNLRRVLWVLIVGCCFVFAAGYWRWTGQLPGILVENLLRRVKVPSAHSIQAYATDVPNARSLTLGAQGTLFVGSRRAGKVYALLDHHKKGKADEIITIAQGLDTPNGVAFRGGALYVAEAERVLRYDHIETNLKNPPVPVVIRAGLPSNPEHASKFIRFGPDGWLYLSVGAPCNVCEPKDERYATIMRMQPDGSDLEVFARGVRDSVGFDWQPQTNELWFTDNGSDGMGDDIPPDELNSAPHQGMHFGFPYCYGDNTPNPEFGRNRDCAEFTPPALDLPAHVASLGARFYSGAMFPAAYQNQIFIAEHGSWNRSSPTGYRISLADLSGNQAAKYEIFAQGWLWGALKWGRPVDLQVMPDGALLVSDDYAGAIYRITYQGR